MTLRPDFPLARVERSEESKTPHPTIGIAIRAPQAGHSVRYATASQWVVRLGRYPS
jgi:hypothetical protein